MRFTLWWKEGEKLLSEQSPLLPEDTIAWETQMGEIPVRLDIDVSGLRELGEYAAHASWRCDYRTRYKVCHCGLDELCDRLGLERIPPNDPEVKPTSSDGSMMAP